MITPPIRETPSFPQPLAWRHSPPSHLAGPGAAAGLTGALEVGGSRSCLDFLGIAQEGACPLQGAGVLALPFFDGSEVAESFFGICSG